MTDQPFSEAQRAEIKAIVHEALAEFFKGYGITGKNIIVTTAVIIGSLAVITGGLKWIIGLFGYSILKG